ncbi:MAG: lysozyme inhibitor [Acidimicrobiia bacterium]|nr:lysozyme inhibitor [Acidimicrobiia bacterium]
MTTGHEAFVLRRTTAASGVRYVSAGTPAATCWDKGKVARLTMGETTYPECVQKCEVRLLW